MKPMNTCGGCRHLNLQEMPAGVHAAFCERTELLVPQHMMFSKVTLWRVPIQCPLPTNEVIKSEDKAPQEDWVIISTDKTTLPKRSLIDLPKILILPN